MAKTQKGVFPIAPEVLAYDNYKLRYCCNYYWN